MYLMIMEWNNNELVTFHKYCVKSPITIKLEYKFRWKFRREKRKMTKFKYVQKRICTYVIFFFHFRKQASASWNAANLDNQDLVSGHETDEIWTCTSICIQHWIFFVCKWVCREKYTSQWNLNMNIGQDKVSCAIW